MATVCKTRCPQCGDVLLRVSSLIIDDEDGVYRFNCPGHNGAVDKPLTEDIRDALRRLNVPTVDETVMAFSALLEDDRNIVRGLGTMDA